MTEREQLRQKLHELDLDERKAIVNLYEQGMDIMEAIAMVRDQFREPYKAIVLPSIFPNSHEQERTA